MAEGGAVSAGLAVAESENAVEQLAQTVAPVAEEEMLSLLEQLKEEPTNDEEMAGRKRGTFLPRFCSRTLVDCVAPPPLIHQ